MRVENSIQPSPMLNLNHLLTARVRQSRISLPVQGAFGYTRLKHIQGVPAGSDSPGFSVQRLQVIDSLIDRLLTVKKTGSDATASKSYESVAAELHRAIGESGSHSAGLGISDVGTFLSMLV